MKRTLNKLPWVWIALVGLVLVTYAATLQQMNGIESVVFRAVYALLAPLQQVMLGVTQLGSLGMLLVAILVAFIVKHYKLAIQILVGGGLSIMTVTVLKSFIARPRPFDLLDTVVQYDKVATGFGYPSGHTAIAVALTLLLWPVLPRSHHWVVAVLAVLVSLSRISLGVHAPLDVVGGALIAYIAVSMTQKAFPLTSNETKSKS